MRSWKKKKKPHSDTARAAAEQTRGGLMGAGRRRRWLSPAFVYDLFTSYTHQSAAVLQEHEPIRYEVEPAGLYRPPRPEKTPPAVRPQRRSVVTLRAVFSFRYRKVPVKAISCTERSIVKGLCWLNHSRHHVLYYMFTLYYCMSFPLLSYRLSCQLFCCTFWSKGLKKTTNFSFLFF